MVMVNSAKKRGPAQGFPGIALPMDNRACATYSAAASTLDVETISMLLPSGSCT